MEKTEKLNHDIYKFCSFEIAELIVSSRMLKFNNPKNFNDPFDCNIDLLQFDFSDCCDEVLFDIEESKKMQKSHLRIIQKNMWKPHLKTY